MSMYAIGIIQLMSAIIIFAVKEEVTIDAEKVKQAAFEDNLKDAGKLTAIRMWWDTIIATGKFVGCYAKPSKKWLIVKEQYLKIANQIFGDAGVKITSTGKRHLGAVNGNEPFKN